MSIKIDTKNLTLRPVPAGHYIRYFHDYKIRKDKPKIYLGTVAVLFNDVGEEISSAVSKVHKGDTPIKKLGRAIAHNRCIKAFEKGHHAA